MKKQNMEIQKPFIDIVRSYNNGVYAVYLIGKDILEVENKPELLGVPFLVWNGSWTPIGQSAEKASILVGVSYLSKDYFKRIEDSLITEGNVPEKVNIHGKNYSIRDLAGN